MDKEYILKHKEHPVLLFKLNDDFELSEMGEVFDSKRLPFGLKYEGNKNAQYKQLSDWIENRGLPKSRSDLVYINKDTNTRNSVELCFGSYALNLTDQYWAHGTNEDLCWEKSNFFDNPFGNIIDFDTNGTYKESRHIRVAPDLTVDGSLRKKWIIDKKTNIRFLLKGSRYDEMQEPFNEVIAGKIMELFGIEHVEYGLIRNKSNNMPLCYCECMVDRDTEYMTAQYVKDSELRESRNEYDRLIEICEKNGINGARQEIDKMIVLDYIMGNTDRHTGNFGIIRNAGSLKWLNVAKIFDNGNSLCHEIKDIGDMENYVDSYSRWFNNTNFENLKYIEFPEWYSQSSAKKIIDIVDACLADNDRISSEKKEKLVKIVGLRIKGLEQFLNDRLPSRRLP